MSGLAEKLCGIACTIKDLEWVLQWNPNFLNPRFLEPPDNSNQLLFPLDLLHSTKMCVIAPYKTIPLSAI